MEKQSLKQLIESTQIGGTFTTNQTRAGISQAAKRANVRVQTTGNPGNYQVTVLGKLEADRSALDIVKDLSVSDRLALFEHFELCCGMNRGECVCLNEAKFEPEPVKAKTDDALAAFIAKAQAKKGITQSVAVEPEPVDEWIGWTPEAQTYDDQTGEMRTYRKHIKSGKVRWIDSEVYY